MRKKKLLIGSAALIVVFIIVGVVVFAPAPSAPSESSAPEELLTEGTPPNLLVVPEVPLGTLAIILACFMALIISQMKSKAKVR